MTPSPEQREALRAARNDLLTAAHNLSEAVAPFLADTDTEPPETTLRLIDKNTLQAMWSAAMAHGPTRVRLYANDENTGPRVVEEATVEPGMTRRNFALGALAATTAFAVGVRPEGASADVLSNTVEVPACEEPPEEDPGEVDPDGPEVLVFTNDEEDRETVSPLDGAVGLPGDDTYIYVWPDSNVKRATFWFDDDPTTEHSEASRPFDARGATAVKGKHLPNPVDLAPGEHTAHCRLEFLDEAPERTLTARFSILDVTEEPPVEEPEAPDNEAPGEDHDNDSEHIPGFEDNPLIRPIKRVINGNYVTKPGEVLRDVEVRGVLTLQGGNEDIDGLRVVCGSSAFGIHTPRNSPGKAKLRHVDVQMTNPAGANAGIAVRRGSTVRNFRVRGGCDGVKLWDDCTYTNFAISVFRVGAKHCDCMQCSGKERWTVKHGRLRVGHPGYTGGNSCFFIQAYTGTVNKKFSGHIENVELDGGNYQLYGENAKSGKNGDHIDYGGVTVRRVRHGRHYRYGTRAFNGASYDAPASEFTWADNGQPAPARP